MEELLLSALYTFCLLVFISSNTQQTLNTWVQSKEAGWVGGCYRKEQSHNQGKGGECCWDLVSGQDRDTAQHTKIKRRALRAKTSLSTVPGLRNTNLQQSLLLLQKFKKCTPIQTLQKEKANTDIQVLKQKIEKLELLTKK